MWSCSAPTPRPSRISTVMARLTTSREARSLAFGRVALHEALALGIGQVAALAARTFGDQAAGAVDAGRMELHELHVLQRQSGAQHHGVAVAGAGVGRGAGEVGAAVAAGGEDGDVGAEAVQRAVGEVERHDAAAGAVLHDEIDGEVLDEEGGGVADRLLVERVQHARARCGRPRRRCAARCPCRSAWSCRRTGAGRCARPRCARTARRSARAR